MTHAKHLDFVYNLDTPEKTQQFYDDWAQDYDAEVEGQGYASPARAAAALTQVGADTSAPILDLGCGTGISGEAFHAAGFTTIDGTDFSQPMLDAAREKGVYRNLIPADMNDPLPVEDGAYPVIAAIGVFSPGHAPPETIDEVMGKLPRGGLFVFTLNDHALQKRVYAGRINEHADTGAVRVLFREHGDHLPGIGLESTIYVLEKA